MTERQKTERRTIEVERPKVERLNLEKYWT
jgi:hypothetical protein